MAKLGKGVTQSFDANGLPLGAVAVIATTNLSVTNTSSAATLLPGDLEAGMPYRFMTTTDCYLVFGESGMAAADANDQLEPAGGGFGKVPNGATHFRVIRVLADGVCSMSEIG
jgi:hypothetical protein